jgi:hypothetical protein
MADMKLSDDIAPLKNCARRASQAVLHLWDKDRKTFWRSTEHRDRERDKATKSVFFPTASLRSVQALLKLLAEFPEWITEPDIEAFLSDDCLPSLVKRKHSSFRTSLNAPGATAPLNLFTLSLYVDVIASICSQPFVPKPIAEDASARILPAVDDLLKHSGLRGSAGPPLDSVHPFLLYHASRSLVTCTTVPSLPSAKRTRIENLNARIRDAIRSSVERLLAKYTLGLLAPCDSVALAFCAASLSLHDSEDDYQRIATVLGICSKAQDSTGCWPLGRIVQKNKDMMNDRLEISTHEIAGVLADATSRVAYNRAEPQFSEIAVKAMTALRNAGRFAENSFVRLTGPEQPRTGWCSEHPYGGLIIESWTSAIVLQSLLSLATLVDKAHRATILAKFVTVSPEDRDWPKWLRWIKYMKDGETDAQYPTLKYLNDKLILPIRNDPRHLPKPNPRSTSVLLFGPPGTSKTTLVKAVADALEWPVVFLTPGDFIRRGLEYIEEQTREVFERLMDLSQAVVLFDECDELFRDRAPLPTTEQMRGITAFVTASMLPKLQELHDRGRVVFLICTNNFESIDSAIKRGGRIDHIVGVGPPDEVGRQRIITEEIATLAKGDGWGHPGTLGTSVVNQLASRTERFTRTELARAVRVLAKMSAFKAEGDVRTSVNTVVEQMADGLVISEKEYKRFRELKRQYSMPVVEKG